jgi:hypothetical protein
MPLDIVIPHLLLPPDAPEKLRALRLPGAERWLARADFSTANATGGDAWIAAEHGISNPVPHAAISLAGEGIDTEGEWIRADPVHLRVDHDDVVLHDGSVLELNTDETASLVAALQAHFAADGFEFQAVSPQRWYVRVPAGESPTTVPLERAIGRNVFGMLPRGTGRINWPSALTEAQMTLSSHDVNTRRSATKLAVNSLWFWGEGPRPAGLSKRYDVVYADDAFSLGIARLSGAEARVLPAGIDGVTGHASGPMLVVITALARALRHGGEGEWISAATALDRQWFGAMAKAIARFGTVRVILPTEKNTRIATLTGASRWRIFRSRKPIGQHA